MSTSDSAYDSPRSCDPVIFGDRLYPDDVFSNLFAPDASPENDLHFFKEGVAASTIDNDNAHDFTFDTMVNYDACQPPTTFADNETDDTQPSTTNNSDDDNVARHRAVYPGNLSLEGSDHPPPTAATSSALQPLLGAPT